MYIITFIAYNPHFFFISQETNFKEPLRIFSETELESFNMHYYSAEVHTAAFILPRFARKALDEIISNVTDEVNTSDR
jgi:spermidine synthase